MLKKDVKVIRPKKTKIYKQKENRYVYAVVDAEYKPDKQYVVESRVCVGKMLDDEYMIPNEKFLEMFPEEAEELKEVPPEKSDSLKIGAPMLINRILEDERISMLLSDIHGDQDSRLIKDLVSYMIINETSTMQHFPGYEWEHLTTSQKNYDDTQVSGFLKEKIRVREIDRFLDGWNDIRPDKSSIYISYDSTNMNTRAEGIEFGEYGHAKDNDEVEQVNISYAIDHKDATPLFYELYPGSIIDNSQCRWMVDKARKYGYTHIGLILDRGYFSQRNISYFDKNGYEFLMMIKTDSKLVKDKIKEAMLPLMTKPKYYLSEHEVYGLTKEGTIGDSSAVRYFHIYYDNVRAGEERNRFLDSIIEKEKQLEKKTDGKLRKEEELLAYKKLFRLKFDEYGYLKSYKRDEKKIEELAERYGFFVIVTSKEMTASEALDIYRRRDSAEKMFMSLKSGLEYDTYRVHTQKSLEAKTHVVFIASIVRNGIFRRLKEISGKDKKNFTVPAAIRELERVNIVKDGSGKYIRRYGLTAKQRKILSAFGITEKQINDAVKSINKTIE